MCDDDCHSELTKYKALVHQRIKKFRNLKWCILWKDVYSNELLISEIWVYLMCHELQTSQLSKKCCLFNALYSFLFLKASFFSVVLSLLKAQLIIQHWHSKPPKLLWSEVSNRASKFCCLMNQFIVWENPLIFWCFYTSIWRYMIIMSLRWQT